MKSYFFKSIIYFLLCLLSFSKSFAQCPIVDNNSQVLCNLESLFVADLEAIDNGGGIAWFDTATSTNPLDPTLSLINGENYFADSATGDCGTRQEVILTVLGAPVGPNFQGVCVESALEATIADLNVTGNDVQWYLTETGGTALANDTVLTDDTIYHADQSDPTTNCRTSRLAVLVNVGIVPIPEGEAFQQFCTSSDNIPTVNNLNATGINNWYLSASSATPLALNTPLINNNTYFANSIDPPCESDSRLMVTVELLIQNSAGSNGNLDICENDSRTYDLFDSLNGTPDIGGTWSPSLNSGSGVFDPTIDSITTYTYTVVSNNDLCSDSSASVSVGISEIPIAGSDGTLDICENDTNTFDLFDSLNDNPDTNGIWSPVLNSGTGVFDPTIDTAGVYTYTVESINPNCDSASAQVTVSFALAPDAGSDGTLDICESDTNTFDLFDSLNGTPDAGGTWSPNLNSGTGIFDPAIDAEGVYTYTVPSANEICQDAESTVSVSILPSPNAGSEGTLDICENDTNTFDLFDSLNNTPDTGGIWLPVLNSGTGVFDPTIDTEGVYTYTVESINPNCDSASAQVTVSFALAPNAGSDGTLDICESDTNTFDLFDSLNGTPDAGGTWTPALNSGTGVFDPATDAEGVYTYTVPSANEICQDAESTVSVSILPSPNAGSEGTLDICENDTNTFDLFDSLNNTPDTGGTWSPALNSGTGVFDPAVDTEGVYTYTVESTNPNCDSASAQVTVSFAFSPNAGSNGTLDICESDTNTFDLFDSLNGTPDAGGTWTPDLNSGSGIFDPAVDTEGAYTYTVPSANEICQDAESTVSVSILPSPNAGSEGTLDICENDTNTFDLFDSLNNTPDTGGIWLPVLNSGTGVFDPTIDTEGVYTYTVESINPNCDSASAQVTVSFALAPNAGSDGTLDICENDTNTFDLFDSLNGTPDAGGTWTPDLNSGSGIFDPTVDTEGAYTYTVPSANEICEDANSTVIVSISPSPNAGADGSIEICESDTNTFDLFDSLNETPDIGGIWSPALTSGTGVFDPTSDNDGVYTYTVESTNPNCDSASAQVTVSFALAPNAGNEGALQICEQDTTLYNLFDSLNGTPDTGGTWTPALNSGTGVFDPATDTEGVYTYTVPSANGICEDANSTVSVLILASLDAGSDGTLDICESDTNTFDLFDSLNDTPGTGGTWSPALNSGTGVFDPAVDTEGVYTYTVESTNPNCDSASAQVTVSFALAPNAGSNGTLDICESDTNTFDLFDSLNGTPDAGGTWTPDLNSGSGIFDPTVDTEGAYTYTVPSANEICEDANSTVIVSISPSPNAGADGSIEICESDTNTFDLFDSLNETPDIGGIWSPALTSGTDVFDPTSDNDGVYTYTVESTNPNCDSASAQVTVSFALAPNAGNEGALQICEQDTTLYNLFDSLNGTPDTGGTWTPALNSGTGVFDPATDTEGVYTYTVPSANGICEDANSTVSVLILASLDAGSDGTLDICESDTNTFDLFDSLNDTPGTGGTWSPALNSGTGVFDPAVDTEGIYTYTVESTNPNCDSASAQVTVSFAFSPNAGSDGTLDICESDTNTFDLFDSLNGTPDAGGTWTPDLNSGSGIFDPTVDTEGAYTYTVPSANEICEDANSTVIVSISPSPNAGADGSIEICESDTNTFDLFDSLNETPDIDGIWSPALTSGTGVFDPTSDNDGVYTYTVESIDCEQIDTAEVLIITIDEPNLDGLSIAIADICQGTDLVITISNAIELLDGDYSITFGISGANTINQNIILNILNGEGNFTLNSELFLNSGTHEFTINNLSSVPLECSGDVSNLPIINFTILENIDPILIEDGNSFCASEAPTIASLTNNISNANGAIVEWYDTLEGGILYESDTLLSDGITYYASIISNDGCDSSIRLGVTVILTNCIEGIIIPDGFSPNNDGINDTFNIRNIDVLYPNFKISIYNRYGNKLYEGDIDSPQWNGTSSSGRSFGDAQLPVGVYVFIIEFNDGIRKELQGRVYLNR